MPLQTSRSSSTRLARVRVIATLCLIANVVLSTLAAALPASPAAAADPCTTPVNPIVAENCQTGNPSSEWTSAASTRRRSRASPPT